MNDISSTGHMQIHGRDAFVKSFEAREARARNQETPQGAEDSVELSGPRTSPAPVVFNTAPQMNISSALSGQTEKEWTVLCYIDGHNDLEPYAALSMLDLEAAGSDKNVTVLAELGRISQDKLKEINEQVGRPYEPTNIDGDWSGVRRYVVQKDDPSNSQAVREINSPVFADLGEKDMSDPKTLSDFMTWGIQKYPAKHYLVVLMDHGGGWRGAFTDDATAGGNHIMTTPQIASAFRDTEKATGVKPDVIDMVACLMGSGEVAYELKDRAQYMTGSEEIATTDAFIYSPLIQHLQGKVESGSSFTARDLATHIVDYYRDKPSAYVTKSAMDLSKMPELKDAINVLAEKLMSTSANAGDIREALNNAQSFSRNYYLEYYSHIRDLYSVAEQISKSDKIADEGLKSAAEGVMKAVNESVVLKITSPYRREEVVEESQSPDGREHVTMMKISEGKYDAQGISIYGPTKRDYTESPSNMGKYGELQLSRDTKWDKFLIINNKKVFGS
ncbi:MAG: clostripain-related cysteine peptidase [Vulcanimicrobiota bacterium]